MKKPPRNLPLLTQVVKTEQDEEDFWNKHPEKTRPVRPEQNAIPALEYCHWMPESTEREIDDKKLVMSCYPYCCFNHMVGMPTIKYEDKEGNVIGESQPMEFYEYEKEMVEEYEATNYYGVNKCRGAGESEIITVRHMAFKYATTRIQDRKCLIVAGTNQQAADVLMHRIKDVLDKVPFVYKFKPRTDFPTEIFTKFGMILSLAANPNVVRSYENVGDLIYEESAFWNRVDDIPVLLAGEPHVAKSSAHIGNLSTPNGQRGFMWTKIFNPEVVSKYRKQVLNWREVCGLPEPEVENLASFDLVKDEVILKIDISDRNFLFQYFTQRYDEDPSYKSWFDKFFKGKTIERILAIKTPVLNPLEVIRTYFTDRAEYDQEYDNQFILSESRAFGEFQTGSFEPVEFDEVKF